MAGMYPPGYSYVYGPPGRSDDAASNFTMQNVMQQLNSNLREVSDTMRTAASRMTGGMSTGLQSLPGLSRQLNPPMGGVAPAWIAGQGQMYLQPPSLFNTLGVTSQRYYGPGYPYSGGSKYDPGGGLGATMAGERHFQREMLVTSIKGRGLGLGLDLASFAPMAMGVGGIAGSVAMLPFMAAGQVVKDVTDLNLSKKRWASEIYRMSPSFMPPSVTGGVRGGLGVEQATGISNTMGEMYRAQSDISKDDLGAMLSQSMRSGWYRNVKNARDFERQYKDYVSTIKDAAGILDKSVGETGQLISTLKNLGARGSNEIRSIISGAKVQANWTGSDVNSLMAFGVNTGQGLTGRYLSTIGAGANMSMGFLSGARTAYGKGMISPEMSQMMGGPEGIATGASNMVSNFNSGPMMQMMMTKMMQVGAGGKLELNGNFNDMISGRASIGNIMGRKSTIDPVDFLLNQRQYMTLLQDQPGVFRKAMGGMLQGFGITDPRMGALAISKMTGMQPDEAMVMMKTIGMGSSPGFQRQQRALEWEQAQRTARVEAGTGNFLNGPLRWYRGLTANLAGNDIADLSNINILDRPGERERLRTYTEPISIVSGESTRKFLSSNLSPSDKIAVSIFQDRSSIGEGLKLLRSGIRLEDALVGGDWFKNQANSLMSKIGSRDAKAYRNAGFLTGGNVARLRAADIANEAAIKSMGSGYDETGGNAWVKKFDSLRNNDYWQSQAVSFVAADESTRSRMLEGWGPEGKTAVHAILFGFRMYGNKIGRIANALVTDKQAHNERWQLAKDMEKRFGYGNDRYHSPYAIREQVAGLGYHAYSGVKDWGAVQKLADSDLTNDVTFDAKSGNLFFAKRRGESEKDWRNRKLSWESKMGEVAPGWGGDYSSNREGIISGEGVGNLLKMAMTQKVNNRAINPNSDQKRLLELSTKLFGGSVTNPLAEFTKMVVGQDTPEITKNRSKELNDLLVKTRSGVGQMVNETMRLAGEKDPKAFVESMRKVTGKGLSDTLNRYLEGEYTEMDKADKAKEGIQEDIFSMAGKEQTVQVMNVKTLAYSGGELGKGDGGGTAAIVSALKDIERKLPGK